MNQRSKFLDKNDYQKQDILGRGETTISTAIKPLQNKQALNYREEKDILQNRTNSGEFLKKTGL